MHVLKPVGLFRGLEGAALETIAGTAHEWRFRRDETLFREGGEATHAFVVGWGRLRLEQGTTEGRTVVLRYMGEGDLLAAVAVLRGIPLPATAVAVEDGLLLAWSAPRLGDMMEEFPRMARNAVEVVGSRIEELQTRLREVATRRVEQRLAATLLRLAAQSGRPHGGAVEIPFPLSRQELAELTATTLHTVSRTLSAWDQEGIVDARRSSRLVLRKPERLAAIAESD